jgi:hypothetical protein
MGAIAEPSSFHQVALQSCMLNSFETAWVQLNIERLEKMAGPDQNAYIRSRSMGNAILALQNHMSECTAAHGGGAIVFLDIAVAFSSCNRNRTFFDLAVKFSGDRFVHKLKNIYINLIMHVDLGFIDRTEIEIE